MILRWKIAKLVNGSVQVVQNEEKIERVQVHYNRLNYWKFVPNGPGDTLRIWMFTLDLAVVSDVRIDYE